MVFYLSVTILSQTVGVHIVRMMKLRKKQVSKNIANVFLPVITLVVIALLFFFSNYYKPSWTYNWSNIRPKIKDSILSIEKNGNSINNGYGESAEPQNEWNIRKWVMKNASESELLKLTEYPNSIVKATSYEGLIRKKGPNNYKLFNQALNDTTAFVFYRMGCLDDMKLIGEYLCDVFYVSNNIPRPPDFSLDEIGLTIDEINSIQEIYNQREKRKREYFDKYNDQRE